MMDYTYCINYVIGRVGALPHCNNIPSSDKQSTNTHPGDVIVHCPLTNLLVLYILVNAGCVSFQYTWATPPHVLGECTQYMLLFNVHVFKQCSPIHVHSVTQHTWGAPKYTYPIHVWCLWCCPIHCTPIDTWDTVHIWCCTIHMWVRVRIQPKYILGTRCAHWVYVLGNSPCTLDNIFSCVLGNTNVIQDIYPINIRLVCDPMYIDVIQHTYFHICWGTFVSWRTLVHMYWTTTMCVGQQRHVLGMYWCIGWHRMCVGHIYWTSAPNTHPQYTCMLRDTHPQYTLMLANIFTQYLYIYMLPNMCWECVLDI